MQPREGKRRAHQGAPDRGFAVPADLARMWANVATAQTVLGRRRLYYLATGVEELLADQLSLIGMLQDWVPVSAAEVEVLTGALRSYADLEIDVERDREAEALRTCIRGMTLSRARSSVPFPTEDDLTGVLLG